LGDTALDAANQKKILGYFIDEAKEHLETLEQGISDLSATITDSEKINELFRAAHSIKGGAAMLGYSSIQKTAHRLEDAFKIFREHRINVDEKLELLFLNAYDILRDLIEKLQSPAGLQEQDAQQIVQKGEPIFVELQSHLNLLLNGGVPAPSTAPKPAPTPVPRPLATQIKDILKQMLNVFKQQVTPDSRQQLQKYCTQLGQLAPNEKNWQNLLKVAATAIANPKHSYRTLAPVVIKDLKRGSDLIELGKSDQITSSPDLKQLATAQVPQVLISLEPQSVATTLLKVFNKQQVSQLVQLLQAGK
jgi:chemotaxis protein histidine kinase CheA